MADKNGWTFLDKTCKEGLLSFLPHTPASFPQFSAEACSAEQQKQCQTAFQSAAASCKGSAASPQEFIQCIATILVGTECKDCFCEVAKDKWVDVYNKVCVDSKKPNLRMELPQVQSEMCAPEVQKVCHSKINATVMNCKESVRNPIAFAMCIEKELNGTGCHECLCNVASEQGWDHVDRLCKKTVEWNTPKAPREFGCGEKLELECAEDIVFTFEACAKAEAEGWVNPIADFKCVRDILKLSSNCCECVCKYIEEHHPTWKFENDECHAMEKDKICAE
jgi:hypothetical protein